MLIMQYDSRLHTVQQFLHCRVQRRFVICHRVQIRFFLKLFAYFALSASINLAFNNNQVRIQFDHTIRTRSRTFRIMTLDLLSVILARRRRAKHVASTRWTLDTRIGEFSGKLQPSRYHLAFRTSISVQMTPSMLKQKNEHIDGQSGQLIVRGVGVEPSSHSIGMLVQITRSIAHIHRLHISGDVHVVLFGTNVCPTLFASLSLIQIPEIGEGRRQN
mmetsp:Transcript_20439/g.32502  ORF Transcript_20439/g.32502 Transcript_20439/m.32502 type:complete len:217 (+) Transcript_20439:305-955(+)